jgi:aerobic-type carbon monoxide dehydrogenase small subunit (CoxS/CutS family)
VHVNGEASRSCVLPVSSVAAAKITTIEGLSATGDHPVQKAWEETDVPQCGYCQAGQIMTAAALLKRNPKPSKTRSTPACKATSAAAARTTASAKPFNSPPLKPSKP